MFYRDFYIQFCYLNNPNARDETNNRRYEQKEFICDIDIDAGVITVKLIPGMETGGAVNAD